MAAKIKDFDGWSLSPICKYCDKEVDLEKKENIAFNNLEEVFHVICYEIRERQVL